MLDENCQYFELFGTLGEKLVIRSKELYRGEEIFNLRDCDAFNYETHFFQR